MIEGINEDLITGGLIEIAKRIQDKRTKDKKEWRIFPDNGESYDSALFMMHPYCYCESEECKWCEGEEVNFLHKPTGLAISWYKRIGRGMTIENPNNADFVKVLAECCDELAEEIEKV
jgi:hypothetical protein